MNDHAFTFRGARLRALPSGALWWPEQDLLCVSDLHLGKSGRIARRGGGMLPPYEGHATLARLADDLDATRAGRVICLGDSFDDAQAAVDLAQDLRLWLARLIAGRDWIWVEGNHDPGPPGLPGQHRREVSRGALVFRHIAAPLADGIGGEGGAGGEVSGHYHPKARLGLRGASVCRPCFLYDDRRIVMPAYGSYTGGLWTSAPELTGLMAQTAVAVLTGSIARAVPMPRAAPGGRLRRSA